jgi:3-hydroxyisobutyrate dehydrogenase-like beta-hydroxyacid dehydrogenase
LAGDISPDFSIKMGIKDLNMALELASNLNFDPKFGQLSHAIFSNATEFGMGDQDCTAILNYFNKLNIKT